MTAFYFDVGGVIIDDNFAPENALATLTQLSRRHNFDPVNAYTKYLSLQPALDSGEASLQTLCSILAMQQAEFEAEWVSLHPVKHQVLATIESLLGAGNRVGLATNICRQLLDLLIATNPILQRLTICCSSDFGEVKPRPEFFKRAAEIIDERHIILIDDRIVNVQAAQAFGWEAIQVTNDWLTRFSHMYLQRRSEKSFYNPDRQDF
jgi:HAD superfamily hydrolase (TIGR01509 family)